MAFVQDAASFIVAQSSRCSDGPTAGGLRFIHSVASHFLRGINNDSWPALLLDWQNSAHESMSKASSSSDLNAWREFYTLCCILRGLLRYDLCRYVDAIAILDHAIIIAGITTYFDQVLSIIHKIQSPILDSERLIPEQVQLFPPSSHGPPATALKNTIPSLTPPSFLTFQNTFSKSPFILRSFASDWPAMRERPWSSTSYLLAVSGPGRVVPVEVGHDYRSASWTQKIMPWDEFLLTLSSEHQSNSSRDSLYLAQHDLTHQFPSLRNDIDLPDYVYASLDPTDYPNYHPPHNDAILNTWLGPKGAMSPAHTDPYHNLYVQLAGYKSVWLAPPSATPSMYPLASCTEPNRTLEGSTSSNTSQVDVFRNTPDRDVFPDFENEVVPVSMTACLGPGDALFFPPGWWHGMRSESNSFSLSMWF